MATTGKCHCGAISYSAEGPPEHHALCHCADCRRWSGAPMAGWIAWKEDQVTIIGEPVTYRSSERGNRDFCGTCGTGLFYRNAQFLPGIIDVHSGTLDDPEANPPGAQIMVKDRLSWTKTMTDLPEFKTYPGDGLMADGAPDVIARWHAYMAAPSAMALDALLDEDVVFRSPAVHTPQRGKAVTMKYLEAAATVLGNPSFRYTGEWRAERSAVLEFECEIDGGIKVNGVDIIAWNEAGLITNFKVMVRPMKALNAVVPLMASALGA